MNTKKYILLFATFLAFTTFATAAGASEITGTLSTNPSQTTVNTTSSYQQIPTQSGQNYNSAALFSGGNLPMVVKLGLIILLALELIILFAPRRRMRPSPPPPTPPAPPEPPVY